ncbi:MAG: flagellar biosynthesis protein FlhB [Devosia sp. 67-54]|uniref:flagellar biosynthesis protein FlhB n=1 Tax=unclassified Devosia TaxID=196773 RepID=UPI0009615C33|nr:MULTISPECIES: flagellar biosynthesis protein FlhB [unclassified Devosia]MBN9304029.1 flagellar biosynthesis protein FlhB [Devosia sp.]OJX17871.1 MAG: flagellar biosynthesis protein FlhB [Devosia sp. 67-54]
MSDEAPEQSSKTEDPSQKKLDDAHKRGDVVKSQEVNNWFMIAGSGLLFSLMAAPTTTGLATSLKTLLANADQFDIGGPALTNFFTGLAVTILTVALVPLTVLMVFGIAANLVQHRPLLSLEPITPKFSKISPIQGGKRLFSRDALVNFVKGLVKLGVVGGVVFAVMWSDRDRLEMMVTLDPGALLPTFQEMGLKIFGAVLAIVTVIALADYVYQRQRWWTRLKMTVQEVRDEYKQMEGDPKIKGRIKSIRNERSRRRMMANVPNATVVITNPTHFAVALKYDRSMSAPLCLAKGADDVAFRIRELAKAHDVPIVENPPLARALFASVDVDESIPTEHFKAVAQVIGFVMRMRDKRAWKA